MSDTIAHKRAVVDAYDEGFQAAHDVALEALDVAKRLEAENERLRHDLDVARALDQGAHIVITGRCAWHLRRLTAQYSLDSGE